MGESEHILEEHHHMDPFEKGRKTVKKLCCCGVGWLFAAIASLVIGIALLVKFAKYLPEDEAKEKEAAGWIGVVFLLLGFLLCLIAVLFFIALRTMYKRYDKGANFATSQFTPPFHNPGQAPYPQQPSNSPCYAGRVDGNLPKTSAPPAYSPNDPLASNSAAPSAPHKEKLVEKNDSDVAIDNSSRL